MAVPPGFADVAMRTALSGDPEEFITTFGVTVADPLTQAVVDDLSDLCALFWLDGSFHGTSGALIPSQGEFRGIRVAEGNDGPPNLWESVSGAAAGTGTTTLLTQNTTYLIRKTTGIGGRANRGRWYIPFAREANVSDTGVLSGGTVTYLTARAEGFRSDLAGMSTPLDPMVILHADGSDPTPVTAMITDALCATQRRRLRP